VAAVQLAFKADLEHGIHCWERATNKKQLEKDPVGVG
jgi:hypothetical protein